MSTVTVFLAEFDQETATLRRFLERIPEEHLAWRPHPKSMSLGRLGTHLSLLPGWIRIIVRGESFDTAAGGSFEDPEPPPVKTMVALFDSNVAGARQLLASLDATRLAQPWSLRRNGKLVYTKPRAVVLRNMFFNHLVHHRAQLGVYLRLHSVPLPATYGPSADEEILEFATR